MTETWASSGARCLGFQGFQGLFVSHGECLDVWMLRSTWHRSCGIVSNLKFAVGCFRFVICLALNVEVWMDGLDERLMRWPIHLRSSIES
jgi:hypothetical protein